MEPDHPSAATSSPSHRTKLMVAGVAMASAGALAVTPTIAAPVLPDIQVPNVQRAAVELSAIANPLVTLQQTFANSSALLATLNTNVSTSSAALTQALGSPTVQAQFAEFLTTRATDPLSVAAALANLPDYGNRLVAALTDLGTAQQGSSADLPAALLNSLNLLAQGQFLDAFSDLNIFLLVDVLSEGRETLLDAFRIPGDFAAALGADPVARVLYGVINRTVVGNLGRALLGPTVTSIIQTAEILDATREALQVGDVETAVDQLVNAPARILNAYLNGYVPQFIQDGELLPGLPPQVFPGVFSARGTLDFFLVQLPAAITTALNAPPVVPTVTPNVARTMAAPTDIPSSSDTVLLKVDEAYATEPAPIELVTESVVAETVTETDPEPSNTTGAGSDTTEADAEPTVESTPAEDDTTTDADADADADTDADADSGTDSDESRAGGTPSSTTAGGDTAGDSTGGGESSGGSGDSDSGAGD